MDAWQTTTLAISDEYVTTLLEDRRGTLWVGTRSGGLNALDPRTGRFTRYQPDPGRADSISHHYVTSLLEDGEGRLWVFVPTQRSPRRSW
jgi:ligand-binding sensor domain-containing protein